MPVDRRPSSAYENWPNRGRLRVGRTAIATAAAAFHLSSCAAGGLNEHGGIPVPAAISEPHPLVYLGAEPGNDAIVRITTPFVSCTGTLIAEDQVLTAHHCLAERDGQQRYVSRDVDPKTVRVELGGDYLPWGELGVKAIVAPPCGHGAGTGDIAVLVLATALRNVPTLDVQLNEIPKRGSRIEAIGFGRCSDSEEGIRRHDRAGGEIDGVSASQFQLKAAICPGDSGGPGVNSAQKVVGVISRSAMDARETTKNRTEFTRIDRWADVLANAARISEGQNPAELPPIGGCDDAP